MYGVNDVLSDTNSLEAANRASHILPPTVKGMVSLIDDAIAATSAGFMRAPSLFAEKTMLPEFDSLDVTSANVTNTLSMDTRCIARAAITSSWTRM